MSAGDSILKFLGSKWFTAILGIVLIIVLPFTWNNFKVVQTAGQLLKFWWVVAVLIINVLSVFLCVYKFMGAFSKQKPVVSEGW